MTNVLPALLRTHSPSPATSSPKTDRGRSRTSSQLPPSSFPAILGDSEFRLGLINSSRPRLPTVGSVPPDVHSCSQALVWSSYFRTPLPTPPRPTVPHQPSHAPLLPAPTGRSRKSGAWRPAQENLPSPTSCSPLSCPLPQGWLPKREFEEPGRNEWVSEVIFGRGEKKLNPELLRR